MHTRGSVFRQLTSKENALLIDINKKCQRSDFDQSESQTETVQAEDSIANYIDAKVGSQIDRGNAKKRRLAAQKGRNKKDKTKLKKGQSLERSISKRLKKGHSLGDDLNLRPARKKKSVPTKKKGRAATKVLSTKKNMRAREERNQKCPYAQFLKARASLSVKLPTAVSEYCLVKKLVSVQPAKQIVCKPDRVCDVVKVATCTNKGCAGKPLTNHERLRLLHF